MSKLIKIKDEFIFLKKSKIKAGEGLDKGVYPFFTSSSNLNKYHDSYEVEGESLIFGTGGSASVHHSYGKFSTSTDCFVVQGKNKHEIDLRYVFLFLAGNIHILENGFKGAGLKHISKKYLENIEISLPLPAIQRKIAEVLDKAQGLIDARKDQIKLMDELIQSVFYEMFGDPATNPKGWEIKKLSELLDKQPQNGMYKPHSDYVTNGTGVPILRIDAFYNGKIENWNFKRLKCNKEEVEKYGLEKDDIVINRVNSIEYLGKCAHIDKLIEPTVYESNMMRFSVNKEIINPYYISRILSHQYIYNQILVSSKKAVNQASINQQDVKSFDIIVPDIDLQREFTSKVIEIEKQKQALIESSRHLEENYKSIMYLAFKDELF